MLKPKYYYFELSSYIFLFLLITNFSWAENFIPFELPSSPDDNIWISLQEFDNSINGLTSYNIHFEDSGNNNKIWENNEELLLKTEAASLVRSTIFVGGHSSNEVDNEIRIPFTVPKSGRYQINSFFNIDQIVSSLRVDITGLSRHNFKIKNSIKILENVDGGVNLLYPHVLSNNEYCYNFGDSFYEGMKDILLAFIPVKKGLEELAFFISEAIGTTVDLLNSGAEQNATFNKSYNLSTLLDLQEDKQYYFAIRTDSWVFAQSLSALVGIQYTYANTEIRLKNLSIVEEGTDTSPTIIAYKAGSSDSTNIQVTFSEDMCDETFLDSSMNVKVSGTSSGDHSCTYNFNNSTYELSINPNENFHFDEQVTVTINSGVTDLAGNGLETPYEFSFIIEDSTISDFRAEQQGDIKKSDEIISGTFDLVVECRPEKSVKRADFYYFSKDDQIWLLIESDTDDSDGWEIPFNSQHNEQGLNGDEVIHFKTIVTETWGQTSESTISLNINNAGHSFYMSPNNINFTHLYDFEEVPDPVDVYFKNLKFANLSSRWQLLDKPEFIQVQVQNPNLTEIQNGDIIQYVDQAIISVKKDASRNFGTYEGIISFIDYNSQEMAEISVVYSYSSTTDADIDLEILKAPIPLDANDGQPIQPPFIEGQKVYWEVQVKNNGSDSIDPCPNLDDYEVGYYLTSEKYNKVGEQPPSYEMISRDYICNLPGGESKVYTDNDSTFTSEDIGKDLYLIALADWNHKIGEGTELESNNYGVYGPFRVLPAPNPDFAIFLDSSTILVPKGKTKISNFHVTFVDEFDEIVSLTVDNPYNGIQAGFCTTSVSRSSDLLVITDVDEKSRFLLFF